jgi:hypothetical protein
MDNIMKNINFAKLGMVALAIALGGCGPYDNKQKNYELVNNQESVTLTIGETFQTSIYNVKKPLKVVFTPPKNHNIVMDGKVHYYYEMQVNPQESIDTKFNLIENGSSKPIILEAHVATFKDVLNPDNRKKLRTTSGKTRTVVGEKVYFDELSPNTKEVVIELHEYDKKRKHYFYYKNGAENLKVTMIAPKYTSFVFDNGTKANEYSFNVKSDDSVSKSINLIRDKAKDTYTRKYKIIRD